MKLTKVFEPGKIGNLELKNRLVVSAMSSHMGNPDGTPNDAVNAYLVAKVKGGWGLVFTEDLGVTKDAGSDPVVGSLWSDDQVPAWSETVRQVHAAGGLMGAQIYHAGRQRSLKAYDTHPVAPSALKEPTEPYVPRALTVEEIHDLVRAFGEAAARAKRCGFDCVEIHAGHSYLLSQFMSPTTNKRTDEFGGCPENRARFTKLVVEEVRKQVGPMFPIFVRISADELMEGGNTLEDTLELLSYFQEEVDAFDVSAGLNGSLQFQIDANYLKDGWRSYMAKAVREKYNKPCVTMGNIRDPRVADDILERGDADIIGMGRGLIADPHWVKKVATGHEDDIRKCISCNIGCAGNRIGVNRPIRCTVNPTVNSGFDYKKKKVNKPCNVVVIGGGTAGLEAACTAAEVGCTTFLFEKNDHLGGLAVEISKIPDKKRLRDFPDYLVHRASKLTNLFIFKGQEATLPLIKALHPNIIVNSTGSNPLLPPIKGLHDHIDKEGSKVASITGMINHLADYPEDCTGKKVVVVGGGAVGLDVVEYFAPKGAQVSIVEMMPQIGKDLDPVSKCGTNTLMREHNVNQMTETALCEVKADAFTVKANGEEKDLPFDYGFVCLGMRANAPVLDEIREAFADTNVEIINIGDSVRARRIIDGVQEGHNILNVLADHEYL